MKLKNRHVILDIKGGRFMSKEKSRPRSLFSNRLRMLRKASNMTQKHVAQKLSIDRSTYA